MNQVAGRTLRRMSEFQGRPRMPGIERTRPGNQHTRVPVNETANRRNMKKPNPKTKNYKNIRQ